MARTASAGAWCTPGSSTETTYYLGGLMEKVVTSTGTDYRHYIPGPGEMIALYSRASSGTNSCAICWRIIRAASMPSSIAQVRNPSIPPSRPSACRAMRPTGPATRRADATRASPIRATRSRRCSGGWA